MKTLTPFLLAVSAFCMSSAALAQAPVKGQPLHVFASNGVKAVAEDLKTQAEKAIGRPIQFTFDSTAGLRKHITAGEPWDVALLTSDAVDDLIKAGTLNSATRADLAR